LTASISKTSLNRRHSVNQIPTLKKSWSIPFLGITITEDKED
jgi:hypothetical protein